MELKPAICPICGGNLRLPENRKVLKCMYCGKDIIVQNAIQKAVGPTVANYLTLAESARTSRNYREAYDYFTKILELEPENYEAWFGKGEAAGWISTLADFRLPEVMTGIKNAIEFCPSDRQAEVKVRGAKTIGNIALALFDLSVKHFTEYGRLGDEEDKFHSRYSAIIGALEVASSYVPADKDLIETIISLCKFLIEGVKYKQFNPSIGEFPVTLKLSDEREQIVASIMNKYIEKMKALEPSYQPTSLEKKSSCFVVTATMGDGNHPSVILLRYFRDEWLLDLSIGRFFMKEYYSFSPYLANVIRERETLRHLSYIFIVRPSVKLATRLLRKRNNLKCARLSNLSFPREVIFCNHA